jgi:hypothetical protein
MSYIREKIKRLKSTFFFNFSQCDIKLLISGKIFAVQQSAFSHYKIRFLAGEMPCKSVSAKTGETKPGAAAREVGARHLR